MAGVVGSKNDNFRISMGLRMVLCRKKKYGDQRGAITKCAEDLQIGLPAWRKYEAGEMVPGSETIAFLSAFFDVDPTWLLTGTGSMDAHKRRVVAGFTEQQIEATHELDALILDLTDLRGQILRKPELAARYAALLNARIAEWSAKVEEFSQEAEGNADK
jgi:transcriptional regulator with XRE-family HTH domain